MNGSSLLLFNKNESCYSVEMLDGKEIKRTSLSARKDDCQFVIEGKQFLKGDNNVELCNDNVYKEKGSKEFDYEDEYKYNDSAGYDNEDDYEYTDTNGYNNKESNTISKIVYNITHCQSLHGKYCNKVQPNPLPLSHLTSAQLYLYTRNL